MKIGSIDTDQMTLEELQTFEKKLEAVITYILAKRLEAAQEARQTGRPTGSILRPTTPNVN